MHPGGAPYDDFPEAQGWDRVISTNVKALFYSASPALFVILMRPWPTCSPRSIKIWYLTSFSIVTAGLTPLLAKDATSTMPGRVINISSVASLDPKAEETSLGAANAGLWSYNASKAAANHLTSTLAVSLGPKMITVNAILPGVFPSKMTACVLCIQVCTEAGLTHVRKRFGMSNGGDKKLASVHPMGASRLAALPG